MYVILSRNPDDNYQTTGNFDVYDEKGPVYSCFSLERAWEENKFRISCIPAATYKVKKRVSKKHGNHFHILDVKDRDLILIHILNFRDQSNGCIGVGDGYKELNDDGHLDLTNSGPTMKDLWNLLPDEFELKILA